ncbi:hypothetical protein OH768_02420 [Streptomyces sp. NBC_01622]|uniref:hypothetical protein n=1 Tax=Streptomyces sp. NBC_01622 TaxID=2975903 RepID=UPI00386CB237|nr:hypothetical protein OH768_02420 [Streptomyces sp. NBC_01622]
MTGLPGFDVLLARLASHRQLDIADLSRSAAIPEPGLRAVFEGTVPSPSFLRRLAPVLQLHAADLFVIADVPVPDELAPLDARAAGLVAGLMKEAVGLPPEHRRRLRRLARSLPQENRTEPVRTPRVYERFERGPGGVLIHMTGSRNLSWTGIAQTFLCLTGRYWAASTYGAVGNGRKELTPDLLADFATVLGIPADTLSVLTGVDLPDGTQPPAPAAADAAQLLWDVRRLTLDQVQQVDDVARTKPHA